MDVPEFLERLSVAGSSIDEQREVVTHVLLGLAREQLIDDEQYHFPNWQTESPERRRLGIHPSPLGAELYLWGCGSAVIDPARIFDEALELVPIDDIPSLSSSEIKHSGPEAFESNRRSIETAIKNGRLTRAYELIQDAMKDVRPEDAPVHYYVAVLASLQGDQESAVQAMRLSASHANATQIRTGLETIAQITAGYPSKQASLTELATILEAGRHE